jgi:hypothetical protein
MNQTKIYLNASIFLAFLSTALLVGTGYAANTIAPVLAMLSGMTTMGALTFFQRFLEISGRNQVVDISFNEGFLRVSIEEVFRKLAKERRPHAEPLPWELSSHQLIGVDNALALAKLRMDLEAQLRRTAHEAAISIKDRSISIMAIAQELVTAKVLPAQFLEPLSEVANVCNRGVHGEEVSNELAISVVSIGDQLLEGLRLLPKETTFS